MKEKRAKKKAKKQLPMEVFESIKTDNNKSSGPSGGIMILVLSLFLMSVVLLTIGLINNKNGGFIDIPKPKDVFIRNDSEDVTDYFDEAFSKSSSGDAQDEVYLQDDPFKDTCADTSGDGVPAISFGTVCYR